MHPSFQIKKVKLIFNQAVRSNMSGLEKKVYGWELFLAVQNEDVEKVR